MHRRLAALLALVALLVTASGALAMAPPASRDARAPSAVLDTRSAIVVLKQQPLATYDGHIRGYARTRPSTGKLNPNSAAAKKYLGYLRTEHSAFALWLRRNVPSARITSQYYTTLNGVAVKLNGAAIGKLRRNTDVSVVEYNALYRPVMSESYKLINASGAWAAAGGRATAGAGIKVGIIDSGIDYRHPFFDPAGFSYPAGFPKCDAADRTAAGCKNVSPKVIVARVFYNKNNQTNYDALPIADIGSHGSHVAGIVAGVTGKTAIVEGVSIDDMSGVAPGAWLGNYNVFPGQVLSARSEDILNAVEQAVLDGMDVLNLSLSGGYRGNNDLLAKGLDTAVAAGVVIAASAGNNGPGGFTLGSPSRARNIITVGASTNQHFVGQPLTYPAGGGTTVGAAVGDFPALASGSYNLFDTASNGCTSVAAGAAGKLAIINRGTCTFSTKVRNAIAAGALGVLVINNVAGDPTAMAKDGLGGDDLPAVMIGKNEGAALRASGATTASADATFSEFITSNGDIAAGFSSQGPTFVDYAIKPDLMSVGVNVLSSEACDTPITAANPCGNDEDWAFYSGTSMSSPHIAGSAAVLKALHPTWTPAMIKSALVTTADLVVKNAFNAATTVGPMTQGGGRENLSEADAAQLVLSPTSASFGRINASRVNPSRMGITLRNLSGTAKTFAVAEMRFVPAPTSGAGAISSVWNAGTINGDDPAITTPTSITVPAGGTAVLTVTVRQGLALGSTLQGWIQLTSGAEEYHVAYWARIVP
jgi:subtilisin family serine protease